ncbi:MAG: hypothetical protein WBE71_27530, partial [Xanthobacteraceae bacterium]
LMMVARVRSKSDVVPVQRGAPTKYDPKFVKTAKFLAMHGATLNEIANCFEISTRTLNHWLNQYPDLRAAVDAGNDVFNPRVERALAERAIGFYADEFGWKCNEKSGERELVVTGRKYYPPDVRAIIFYLKNKVPHEYRRRGNSW